MIEKWFIEPTCNCYEVLMIIYINILIKMLLKQIQNRKEADSWILNYFYNLIPVKQICIRYHMSHFLLKGGRKSCTIFHK